MVLEVNGIFYYRVYTIEARHIPKEHMWLIRAMIALEIFPIDFIRCVLFTAIGKAQKQRVGGQQKPRTCIDALELYAGEQAYHPLSSEACFWRVALKQ